MHPRARRLAVLAVPALAAAGAMLPAAHGAAATVTGTVTRSAAAGPRPAVHEAADTATEQRTVKKFWTVARMETAKPLDAPGAGDRHFAAAGSTGGSARSAPAEVPAEAPAGVSAEVPADASAARPPTVAPSLTAAARVSSRTSGSSWTAGGTVAKTTGRVFFTVTAGSDAGRNASCSGTAVTSANKSVVITAGHCVKLNGAFHANWVFVPGYDQGDRPHGTWPAITLLTTAQWNSGENMNYDVAAAVVAPQGGKSLTDVVGGQGVAFNQPRGRQTYAFGYPAGGPYDGSKLVYCSGRTFDDYLSSQDQGLSCGMTGGASGGPWFLNFSERTGGGLLNSVNSFKYNFASYWMFGPYFGPEAEAVYNTAQKAALT
ncbi:trypsin-like serine peptidase [Microbispora bryophytorum]|uniref:trypsin-like serine peptidase n=1 Tax=Microbispora bryophytorum TaxID=1460882 RepID=UPI0011591C3C|nr:peptidase [Microbispora bryophytorum]MBD3141322.1 peptidase [Microbispora bryophytorum]TQR99148.1 peptidase [Microbispora bryophytorum]